MARAGSLRSSGGGSAFLNATAKSSLLPTVVDFYDFYRSELTVDAAGQAGCGRRAASREGCPCLHATLPVGKGPQTRLPRPQKLP